MLASVVLEHSEAAFVEDSAGFVAVDHEVDLGAVCVADSKARVLVVISPKTYTRITLVPTNSRPVGYEWMVILALPLDLPLNTAVVAVAVAVAVVVAGMEAGSMQSPASR